MFSISKLDINRNPFIGLYLSACDDFIIYSSYFPEKEISAVIAALKPKKTCVTNLGNSTLTGLFSAMNSNAVLVPSFSEKEEVKLIEKELGVNVCKIDDRFSAVKNNVILTDKACILNENMPRSEQAKIGDAVGVEVFASKISGLSVVGSVNVATNKGLLAYNHATEQELLWLSKALKVKFRRGTCNFGTVANSLGIVANSKGAVVGSISTGYELGNILSALE